MKRFSDMRAIVERMAPGVLSRDGFLGTDRRAPKEILDADASAVATLGAGHATLAAKLKTALAVARKALGTVTALDERLSVVYAEGTGRIACPWGSCGTFPKGEAMLTDTFTGETAVFSDLSVHMMAKHGFYQGRGSRYRLDPAAIHRVFRMGTRR